MLKFGILKYQVLKEEKMQFKKIKIFFPAILLIFLATSCTSNLDIQTLNKKANALMQAGDIDGAISRLESINDLNPNFPQTNYNLGIAYYKKGNLKGAIASLNKAVELNRNFADAYYSLGVIYEDMAGMKESDKTSENSPEESSKTLEYLYRAKENYSTYLHLAKDQPDTDTVKAKIEYLTQEIQKHEAGTQSQPTESDYQQE